MSLTFHVLPRSFSIAFLGSFLILSCGAEPPPQREVVAEEDTEPEECQEPDVYCFTVGPIAVEPFSEWQGYTAVKVDASRDLAITGLEVANSGAVSHHFIVGQWNGSGDPPQDGPHDLYSPEGLTMAGNNISLVGSVYKYVNIDTGKHIGVPLEADSWLVLNGHFVNTTEQPVEGTTQVVVHTTPADEVPFLSVNALPGTDQIAVPPGETTTSGGTWRPPEDAAVVLMTSHMHRHGRWFRVWHVTGEGDDQEEELIYETDNYEAPPLEIFAGSPHPEPLVFRTETNDHLRYECTFENYDLDTTIGFGPSADTDEMCIMPIYYTLNPDELLQAMEDDPDGGFLWEYEPY